MSNQIKYNHALEFVCAVRKYGVEKFRDIDWKKIYSKEEVVKELVDFTPSKEVKKWLSYIDNNICPYFSNDLIFVTQEITGLLDVCFLEIIEKDLSEPNQLLENLKAYDPNQLIKDIYGFYDLKIPITSSDEDIFKELSKSKPNSMVSSLLQIMKNPVEYKKRAISSLEKFYNLYYQPFQEDVYKSMKKHLDTHNNLFEKNPLEFINAIGVGDYSDRIKDLDDIDLYLSYFIDLGMFYYNLNDGITMFYGKSMLEKLKSKEDVDTYKSLFQALSDNTRVEILKLTSKKPYYNKELAEHFNLSTATLSYHLNILLAVEVLNFEPSIINNRYYYTTNKSKLKEIFDIALKDLTR